MKKCFVLLLAVIILLASASCGGSGGVNQTADTTTAAAKTEATTQADSGKPDLSKHVSLKMVVLGDRPKDGDLVYGQLSDMATKDINADFKIEYLSMGDYTSKYPLMLSSGEPIDLIYTSVWCFYAQEAAKGSFVEVTNDILQKDMPLTYEQQNPKSFEQSKISGKVYFVPFNLAQFTGGSNIAVLLRGDLRQKYGLAEPKSIDDIVKYFDSVKKEEAGKGMLPYAASKNNDQLCGVTLAANNWCVINGLSSFFVFKYSENPSPDDLQFKYATEEYKQNARLMKQWADAGYWSKNAIANATAPVDSFKNGLSATFFSDVNTVGVAASAVLKDHPDWIPEMYDLNPGTTHFYGSYNGDGIAVPVSSQNPERAFMLLDLLKFNKQYYELFRYGVEGKHWVADGDKKWKAGPDQAQYPYGTGTWGIKNEIYERTRSDIFPAVPQIFSVWKTADMPWSSFIFNTDNVKSEMTNLNNLLLQYGPVLDLGMAKDIDATIDEFVQKCKLAGLDKVQGEMQTQLKAFLATQK